MALPVDRSTETHRVVAINPHDPVHQAIVSNPSGSNVAVKDGYLHFPKPGARGAETSPAAPVVKAESAPKPVVKAVKKAAPKKEPAKPVEVKKTGMAALADKNKARELADARRNAMLKAKKLGK
jgi:hypothetical protein